MGTDYRQYPFAKGHHPAGWVETTVGDVVLEIRGGYSSGKHNQTGQGIPHLRPMNVSPVGDISMEDVRYISPDVGSLRLAENDVLFTNTSSTVWVGKTAHVKNPGNWGFSNHMTRLRVADGMSPEFVARQLHYFCISGYFAFHCKKHINQSSVAGKQLAEDVPFRLPPANEQKRIASKLRRLLVRERRLRQDLDALPALMQQYRAAVLEAACAGRLVPTEAELARDEQRDFEPASVLLERILHERRAKWEADQLAKMRAAGKEPKDDKWKERYHEPSLVGEIVEEDLPTGWTTARLEQLAWSAGYGTSVKCAYEAGGPPVLRIPNVKSGQLHLENLKFAQSKSAVSSEDPLEKADFIIIRTNGSRDLVGVGALVEKGFGQPHYFASYLIRFRLVSESFHPQWVNMIWAAPGIRAKVLAMAASTTGQYNVSLGNLNNLAIPLPPLAEQKRIAAEVERRLSAIARISEQVAAALEQTSQLRVSLFHRALSGKLVNQLRSDEPATKLISRIRAEREIRLENARRIKPQRKAKMQKLSSDVVKEAIQKLPKDRFSFEELSATLQADYDPLKDIVFELLGEAKPSVKQVFDPKAKQMQFQRIKP